MLPWPNLDSPLLSIVSFFERLVSRRSAFCATKFLHTMWCKGCWIQVDSRNIRILHSILKRFIAGVELRKPFINSIKTDINELCYHFLIWVRSLKNFHKIILYVVAAFYRCKTCPLQLHKNDCHRFYLNYKHIFVRQAYCWYKPVS